MKHITLSILMIAGILLTACSSAATGTPLESTSTNLPIETQLAVGTLKLSGSAQDVTVEQAKDLFLYWQVYKELSQSDTVAQAEVDGLVAQIQETMTSDQMQAITEMELTQQDVVASMQGAAVVSGSSGTGAISLPSGSSSGNGMPAGGPPDGGGAPPDGAGGVPGDMGGAPSGSTTSGASQTQSSGAGTSSTVITSVPSALVDAVIQALQQKIAA